MFRSEQTRHLHGRSRRARYSHAREIVRLVDLLDPPARHLVALGGLAVAGHDHPIAVAEREYRRAVRNLGTAALRRGHGEQGGVLPAQEVHEAGARVGVKAGELGLPERIVSGERHHTSELGRAMFRSRSAAVGDSIRSWRTCASVPRSGSSMKIFLRGPSFRSKITESQLAEAISSE